MWGRVKFLEFDSWVFPIHLLVFLVGESCTSIDSSKEIWEMWGACKTFGIWIASFPYTPANVFDRGELYQYREYKRDLRDVEACKIFGFWIVNFSHTPACAFELQPPLSCGAILVFESTWFHCSRCLLCPASPRSDIIIQTQEIFSLDLKRAWLQGRSTSW